MNVLHLDKYQNITFLLIYDKSHIFFLLSKFNIEKNLKEMLLLKDGLHHVIWYIENFIEDFWNGFKCTVFS